MPVLAAIPAGYFAAAGAAAAIAGAGISYMGAQSQAQAASESANYNAEVAANNQLEANQAATVAQQQGAQAQVEKAYQEDVLVGQQKAGLAANGVDVGSGSAVNLLSDTKAAGELDQLTIQNNAAREAQGYLNQGIGYANQAQIDQAAGQAALQGGALKADSALVTGAGQVASSWYKYTQTSSSSDVDSTSGF